MTLKHSNHKQKTIAVENHFDPVFFQVCLLRKKLPKYGPYIDLNRLD